MYKTKKNEETNEIEIYLNSVGGFLLRFVELFAHFFEFSWRLHDWCVAIDPIEFESALIAIVPHGRCQALFCLFNHST